MICGPMGNQRANEQGETGEVFAKRRGEDSCTGLLQASLSRHPVKVTMGTRTAPRVGSLHHTNLPQPHFPEKPNLALGTQPTFQHG